MRVPGHVVKECEEKSLPERKNLRELGMPAQVFLFSSGICCPLLHRFQKSHNHRRYFGAGGGRFRFNAAAAYAAYYAVVRCPFHGVGVTVMF